MKKDQSLVGVVSFLAFASILFVHEIAEAGDYLDVIKPVLKERCYSCHGSLKQKADLRVDTAASLIAAKVVVPGAADESELILRVTHPDEAERMPPEGHALTEEQVKAIRRWIESGAPIPEGEKEEDDPRNHWSFLPVEKPPVPDIRGVSHPVDAFLASKRLEHELVPQGQAERSLLLRRLYLDLIGLPPVGDQLNDERPWESIVEDLLSSPHHGERWGRHWMDVWRYSDWYGLGAQLRYSQKHLWHWRDWIVESLNEDKGYDEMILEMLAGDELAPSDPQTIRATGFLARNYFLFNRTTWLDNTIEHTGKAFLGLTLNCAKCHDHKYDPIAMTDYYRFRAIFEPHQVRLDPVPGVVDFDKNGLPRVFDNHPDAETFVHLRGDPKQPDKETEITAAVPAFLSEFAEEIQPVSLPVSAYAPGVQDFAQEDRLAVAQERVRKAEIALKEAEGSQAGEKKSKTVANQLASSFLLEDDFAELNSEFWELSGNGLQFQQGKLVQTVATREPGKLITREPIPVDFEMTCRYTTTGGATFKSVTFRFDQTDDQKNANFIYTSEHAPGPKVQAAYARAGKTTYPSDGRKKKAEAVGKKQELRIAVRDRLANVWLNGEFVFAYAFPDRIENGRFSLSAFDATAEFESIRIRSLPEEVSLTEASNAPGKSSPNDVEKTFRLVQTELKAAVAEEMAIQATIAADRRRYLEKNTAESQEERDAARLQIEALQLRAAVDLLRYEGGDSKKLQAAKALQKRAEENRKKWEQGEFSYEPLRGSRKALETPAHKEAEYPPVYPETSTGRRTMLAKWIASPKNPLTPRVAVNHVWTRHFGQPLVDPVFDFGRQTKRPIHADLLDFLAAEFVESGWSFRHLHRLLVTSQVYQMSSSSSGAGANTLAEDSGNRFYWRMNARRMESQVVHDSLQQLAGTLDATMGGPSLDSKKAGNRRALYFTHSPDKQDLFLTTFDDADLLQCYRRSESVVPQQALALSNSSLSLESAEKIAQRFDAKKDPSAFVVGVFRELLARSPSEEEVSECLQFLQDWEALVRKTGQEPKEERGRSRLVHALLNHNDFITIR